MSYNGAGCDYNNKYEIPTYGSEPSDSIRIQVRHYQDSYIAAEEATKGCSSTSIYGVNCVNKHFITESRVIKRSGASLLVSSTENPDTSTSGMQLGIQFWKENFFVIEGYCILMFLAFGIYFAIYSYCCES